MGQDTEREGLRWQRRSVSLRAAQEDDNPQENSSPPGGHCIRVTQYPFLLVKGPLFHPALPKFFWGTKPSNSSLATGKAMDLALSSQTKAHVFSLVEKVKLSLLEVRGGR